MRKMLRLLLVMLSLLVLCCAAALADSVSGEEKDLAKLCKMVEQANEKIESYVAHAQDTKKNDIDWLLKKVEKVVEPVKEYGEKIGVTVECEMVEYEIDGQKVLVDPLKVINLGDESDDDE